MSMTTGHTSCMLEELGNYEAVGFLPWSPRVAVEYRVAKVMAQQSPHMYPDLLWYIARHWLAHQPYLAEAQWCTCAVGDPQAY